MKEKIENSRFVKALDSLKFWKALKSHPVTGKFINYEVISYLVCGVLTTLVNYIVYFLMPRFESDGLDIVIANAVAWTAAVIFAFIVNKVFVFDSNDWSLKTVLREAVPFAACRILSLFLDTLILYVTVGKLHWNEPAMKILSGIIVIVINYFASKYLIFQKKSGSTEPTEET